ncbi:MAG: hypothetical protein ACXAAM_08700 [Candidatus Heimdallarchaeaceae archaeon]|jgi:hypothetical protein
MKNIFKVLLSFMILALIAGGLVFYMMYCFDLTRNQPKAENIMEIFSDEDFEKYDLPGAGTPNDPYRIENLIIGVNASLIREEYFGLDVANTSKCFVIRNCSFFGGLKSLRFTNLADGSCIIIDSYFYTIGQSEIDIGFKGGNIQISNSKDIIFRNNFFKGASWHYDDYGIGLELDNTDNIVFSNNTFCIIPYFIVENTINATITQNLFEDSYGVGNIPSLDYSENIILDSTEDRNITFYNCPFSKIHNNHFYRPVRIFYCNFSSIHNNTISAANGIDVFYSNYLSIGNNTLKGYEFDSSYHNQGIRLVLFSNFCAIFSNHIYNFTSYGIFIKQESNNNTIFHNSFLENLDAGSTSQASDNGSGNMWYSPLIFEGNYWSNLGSNSTYLIDGTAGSIDLYPLSVPP